MQRKKYLGIKQKSRSQSSTSAKKQNNLKAKPPLQPPDQKPAQDGNYAKPGRNQKETITYLCIQNTKERLIFLCK